MGKGATINSSNNHNQAFGDNKQCNADKERCKWLCEEGKCFTCKGTDHIKHNCPQRQKRKQQRPQGHNNILCLSALRLASPTEVCLAAMQEGTDLGRFSIGFIKSETPELCLAKRQVLITRALSQLRAAVPLTLNKQVDPANSPLQ